MPIRPRALGFLALAALLGNSNRALAAPQVSVGVTVGAAVSELRTKPEGAFHLGGRAEALFLREREGDMAIGTYAELVTERLDTLELGGGAEWLIPLIPSFPLVASGGIFERRAPMFGWEPGLAASLFFGPRSYNFHSSYAMANGVFLQGRYGLGDSKQADMLFGVQIDLAILALPFVFAYQGIAH